MYGDCPGRARVPAGRLPAIASRHTLPMVREEAVGLFPPVAQKRCHRACDSKSHCLHESDGERQCKC
jgi:hypothetical protein